MPQRPITDKTIRDEIKARVKEYGLLTVAEASGFTTAYLSYILLGSKPVTKKIAKAFGYELTKTTTVTYRKIQ